MSRHYARGAAAGGALVNTAKEIDRDDFAATGAAARELARRGSARPSLWGQEWQGLRLPQSSGPARRENARAASPAVREVDRSNRRACT